MSTLSVSIVVHEPDRDEFRATLDSLLRALARLRDSDGYTSTVDIVDNSAKPESGWIADRFGSWVRVQGGQGNLGFGRAHNLCVEKAADFHLILNPDVELAPDALTEALAFMTRNPDCSLLSPAATWGNGERQYLCKRYPTVADLVLRGFAPCWLRSLFGTRLSRYEMRDVIGDEVVWDPVIVSGCFMMFRGEALRRLGGFDPRFFLYFEDFDLCLRTAEIGRIAYVPSVRIVHHGGRAARKGWEHVRMFGHSGIQFFNKHGWRLW